MLAATRNKYLKSMGIQPYRLRSSLTAETVPLKEASVVPEVIDIASMDWEALQAQVSQCQACCLSQTRQKTVFGDGDPQADVLVISDYPGSDEDEQGRSFLGVGGSLLDGMLKSIGLNRQQVFITHHLKCHPPIEHGNLDQELLTCSAYLDRQIEWIKPKVILSLGGVSAKNLLKSDEKLSLLRQQKQYTIKQKIPVQVTYHPGYLLKKTSAKAMVWEDLKKFRQTLQDLAIL